MRKKSIIGLSCLFAFAAVLGVAGAAAACPPDMGMITIDKITDPAGDAQVFDFAIVGINGSVYPKLADATSPVTTDLKPGVYSVSEVPLTGWTQTSVACRTECGATVNPNAVVVERGKRVTCVFTNTKKTGTLIVKKALINDNGGTKKAEDFAFQVDGGAAVAFEADGQNDLTVNEGTYTVTEPADAGYKTTYDNCENVFVPAGQSATCVITNNDIAPKLHLRKIIVNDNGGAATAADFTLTADGAGSNDLSGASPVDSGAGLQADTWTLSEAGVPGYAASEWVCAGGAQNGSTITVGIGGEATCTITNDDIAPSLTLKKVVDCGLSISCDKPNCAKPSDWTLTATGTGEGATNLSGTTPVASGTNFKADTYVLGETGPEGYTGTWACEGATVADGVVALALGQAATCTLTNVKDTPPVSRVGRIKVVKIAMGGDGTQVFSFAGIPGIDTIRPVKMFWGKMAKGSWTSGDLAAGAKYTVTETVPAGWKQVSNTCKNIKVKAGRTVTCVVVNKKIVDKPVCHKPCCDKFGCGKPDCGKFPNGNDRDCGCGKFTRR